MIKIEDNNDQKRCTNNNKDGGNNQSVNDVNNDNTSSQKFWQKFNLLQGDHIENIIQINKLPPFVGVVVTGPWVELKVAYYGLFFSRATEESTRTNLAP